MVRSDDVWKLSVFYLESLEEFLNVSRFWRSYEATSRIYHFWEITSSWFMLIKTRANEVLKSGMRCWDLSIIFYCFLKATPTGWQRNLCSYTSHCLYSSWPLSSCRLKGLSFPESCSVSVIFTLPPPSPYPDLHGAVKVWLRAVLRKKKKAIEGKWKSPREDGDAVEKKGTTISLFHPIRLEGMWEESLKTYKVADGS